MHREHLMGLLRGYEERHPQEAAMIARIRALVLANPDCFERTCVPGHVTGSAFILDASRTRFLLHHHRKLDKWLQFGGHSDGDPDPARVAAREALEESGLAGLRLLGDGLPLDVDVHGIPARGAEAAHEHHDLRYAFEAPAGAQFAISAESRELRWFPCAELESVVHEEGLLRLARKALALPR